MRRLYAIGYCDDKPHTIKNGCCSGSPMTMIFVIYGKLESIRSNRFTAYDFRSCRIE